MEQIFSQVAVKICLPAEAAEEYIWKCLSLTSYHGRWAEIQNRKKKGEHVWFKW